MNILSTINNLLEARLRSRRRAAARGVLLVVCEGGAQHKGILLLSAQSTIQNNVIFSLKIHICHCKFTSRLIK